VSDDVREDFDDLVNMTPKQLEDWLATDESEAAGDSDSGESTGHKSGRRIVTILNKNKDELTDDDLAHMRKVNGYIKRHLAQKPGKSKSELEDATWTHSLRNWGHDPLK
jgi:hypothetical protein